MKSVLQYIKENPDAFMGAAESRSHTSPSHTNMMNHKRLMVYIHSENWVEVEQLITDAFYYKPLEGVVLLAERYGLDSDDWLGAYDAYEAGNIV
ncbi:hypothetical protein HPMBJEAJ_00065 [Aeromonas phage avDM6]|nr:hypothetical protein HPMBJEAJ_00065 [Aeromonas phage avDM6]